VPPNLHDRWTGDVAGFQGPETIKASAFEEIVAAHSQPHRRYHGVGHLEALFALLDQHAQSVTAPLTLHFAVWWHDVVYEPTASDNEARSAALARARLNEFGADPAIVDSVEALILATRNHWQAPAMGDGDYFLDGDIAILGAPTDIYDRYAADVRVEYSFAPDPLYRAGRSKFLSQAIVIEPLFRTTEFEKAYEETARANMRRELERLS
jgi:predicted metal-dependent HD superfamily phosphohydrolase